MSNFWYKFNYFLNRYFRPVTKWLLMANVGIFLLVFVVFLIVDIMSGSSLQALSFYYLAQVPILVIQKFQAWRLVTYAFMHADGMHLLFNMLILFFFGSMVEAYMGSRRFLRFYMIVIVGAALVHTAFSYLPTQTPRSPMIGASGGMYGLLVAAALIAPNQVVYIYALLPIKLKYLVVILMGVSFIMTVGTGTGSESQISHITHLSGGLIALILMKGPQWWGRGRSGRPRGPRVVHRRWNGY